MKPYLYAFSGFAALSLISACASTGEAEPSGAAAFVDDVRLGEKVDKICFASRIDNFRANAKKTVIVEKGVSDVYLVEVFGACPNLRSAGQIALDANGSCLRRGDSLIVSESMIGFNNDVGAGLQRCAVKAIYDWDEDAAKTDVAETPAP